MDKETEVWFAMRATYRRELEAMHLLEKANIGCFIPMQYKISICRGRKVRALVPVIRGETHQITGKLFAIHYGYP